MTANEDAESGWPLTGDEELAVLRVLDEGGAAYRRLRRVAHRQRLEALRRAVAVRRDLDRLRRHHCRTHTRARSTTHSERCTTTRTDLFREFSFSAQSTRRGAVSVLPMILFNYLLSKYQNISLHELLFTVENSKFSIILYILYLVSCIIILTMQNSWLDSYDARELEYMR